MTNPVRSMLGAGVTLLTASALAIAPSVQAPPPPKPTPTVRMAADVQLLALQEQPPLLNILRDSPARLLGPAAPLGTLPTPPAPAQFAIAPNLADTIDSVYVAVEPWVRYGFEVATAVVRWIPVAGWFAGQIMVFYNFGESLVASGVFNFTDWLRGDGSAIENLVDFGVDVGLALAWLGLDELAQFVPLPPFCCYPPRPPVQGPFSTSQTLAGPTETAEPVTAASVEDSTALGPEEFGVVEGPEGDEAEQLGENRSEEQGATQAGTSSEFDDDLTAEVAPAQSDTEEAVEPDDELGQGTRTETTSASSGAVAAQSEVAKSTAEAATDQEADDPGARNEARGGTSETTTKAAKPASRDSDGDSAAKGEVKSSTDSSATHTDTGAKHVDKGENKVRTGKGDRHASLRT